MNKEIKEIRNLIKELNKKEDNKELVKKLSISIDKIESESKEDTKQREELFNHLYGGHTWTKVKKEFERDFKSCRNQDAVFDLYNKYIPYIWFNRALTTSLRTYTDLRNIIRESNTRNTEHALNHVFSIGDKDRSKGVFAYKEKKTTENVLKRVEGKEIELSVTNVKKVVETLKDYVDNFDKKVKEGEIKVFSSKNTDREKAYYVSFLLGLATGRRQVEILKTLKVGSRKGKATFEGLTKPSAEDKEKEKNGVRVVKEGELLFLSVKDVQKYLRLLRKLIDTEDMTTTQINKKYNAVFNKAFRDRLVNSDINLYKEGKEVKARIFGNNEATFHNLRSAYANTLYQMALESNDKRANQKSKFIADVLHQTWTMNASEHYDREV